MPRLACCTRAGERSLGEIRLKQGRTAEALTLMESARQTLLDLRSSGYARQEPADRDRRRRSRLARTKVSRAIWTER